MSILTVSVHPRRKIVSSFTHPHVDPKHYERCFDECPCWSCRAGLVIGHSGHFPGGPTHLRGRQNVFFFFFAKDHHAGTASSQWFVSCIDSVNHPITMRYRWSDKVFCLKDASLQLLPRRLFVFTAALSRTGLLCGE